MYSHKSRDLFILPRQVAIIILVFMVITTCNMPGILPGKQESSTDAPLATSEQPIQGSGIIEAPAVLGFVLDPDGAPVAFASVGNELTDTNGIVSGDLTGSASGWLEIKSPGYATGYVKPRASIGGTAIFESRLTPFKEFLPLKSDEETALTLGDAAQPVAEFKVESDAVATLPAYIEATAYDLVDVGPSLAALSNGDQMDLVFAVAIEGITNSGDPLAVDPGKTIVLKVFPNPALPASPTLAIFNPETGVWQVQERECVAEAEGSLSCTLPRFAPLIGLFGPPAEATSLVTYSQTKMLAGRMFSLHTQTPTGDDQAYQDAKTNVEQWIKNGEWMTQRTGAVSPEWEAEMTNRLEKLADAAEAYAATHPDESGIAHLLGAADPAITTGNQSIADKLMKDAQAIAESMADELLKEEDCGRIREMLHVMQTLILVGGSSAKVNAMQEKLSKMGDCDEWIGHMNVWFTLTSTNPGLDKYQRESGGNTWHELHLIHILTNVQTHALRGEDRVALKFPEVRYGKRDRHNCHNYLTHGGESGGNIYLKFDGQYDGYTFTVGDMEPEGGTATITYGAHMERWDDEKEECEEIQDQTVPAPNYSSILVHGMMGNPPTTMQQILQGEKFDNISGSLPITNDAFDLGIHPWQTGIITWSFMHTQKYLPQK
jgi:hypothetical protein